MNKTLILACTIAFISFGCADEEAAVSNTVEETVISSETGEAVSSEDVDVVVISEAV